MNTIIVDAVLTQLTGSYRITKEAKGILADVANHGADAGFPGFTYYTDTVEFFDKNRMQIIEMLNEYADSVGECPIEVVAGFKCIRDYPKTEILAILAGADDKDAQVKNGLAWFALEEVARFVTDREVFL